jgi:hypothetical protein
LGAARDAPSTTGDDAWQMNVRHYPVALPAAVALAAAILGHRPLVDGPRGQHADRLVALSFSTGIYEAICFLSLGPG